jgi:Flp pilus assembly protein TadD
VAALLAQGHALVRDRQWDGAVAAFRRALENDPDLGIAYGSLGYCFEQLGQPEEAIIAYTSASILLPEHAEVSFNLGNVLRAQGRLGEAAESYRAALAREPGHARALNNLGTVHQMLGEADQAVTAYQSALARKPDYAEAWNNLGGAHLSRNEITEALAAFRKAVAIDPTMERARFNVGIALLAAGDLPAGWTGYEHRQRMTGRTAPTGGAWTGIEPIVGRTLLLTCEQGLGDSLQFVRYADPLLQKGARVCLEVQPPLRRLFASLEGISEVVSVGEPLPAHDLHCSFLSLPHAFATTLASIPARNPYLFAHAPSPLHFPKPGRRIGFTWAGNPSHRHDRWRSIPASQILGALATQTASLVSLQKAPLPADQDLLNSYPNISDASPLLSDFADTAAVIAGLDLVIAVDSAVAHLAGAMGKPVWILLPFAPDWRWMLGRADSPWYPSARLFRQERPGDWSGVLSRVGEALAATGG